jgi:hypothetical protein
MVLYPSYREIALNYEKQQQTPIAQRFSPFTSFSSPTSPHTTANVWINPYEFHMELLQRLAAMVGETPATIYQSAYESLHLLIGAVTPLTTLSMYSEATQKQRTSAAATASMTDNPFDPVPDPIQLTQSFQVLPDFSEMSQDFYRLVLEEFHTMRSNSRGNLGQKDGKPTDSYASVQPNTQKKSKNPVDFMDDDEIPVSTQPTPLKTKQKRKSTSMDDIDADLSDGFDLDIDAQSGPQSDHPQESDSDHDSIEFNFRLLDDFGYNDDDDDDDDDVEDDEKEKVDEESSDEESFNSIKSTQRSLSSSQLPPHFTNLNQDLFQQFGQSQSDSQDHDDDDDDDDDDESP